MRDSGLLYTLLGMRGQETLLGHPVVGAGWEGMLIENILSMVPANTPAWFYRTAVGAEIDLVLEVKPNQRWAIEIKRSLADPTPGKGFFIGCEDIGAAKQIVLYPGDERFKLDAKTEVMPLRTLLSRIVAGVNSLNTMAYHAPHFAHELTKRSTSDNKDL